MLYWLRSSDRNSLGKTLASPEPDCYNLSRLEKLVICYILVIKGDNFKCSKLRFSSEILTKVYVPIAIPLFTVVSVCKSKKVFLSIIIFCLFMHMNQYLLMLPHLSYLFDCGMKSFVFFFISCMDYKPWRLYTT